MSFIVFMALDNAGLSDKVRQNLFSSPPQGTPLVTLGGFMAFWGWVFGVTTGILYFLKSEHPPVVARRSLVEIHKIQLCTKVIVIDECN